MIRNKKHEKEKNAESKLNKVLEEVIGNHILNPPINAKNDIIMDFKERCDKFNECVISSIENIEKMGVNIDFETFIEKTVKIQKCIHDTLEHYLSGDIKSAYDTFDGVFSDESINEHLHKICVPLSKLSNEENSLFRVRKTTQTITERDDIFHIPFSKRHLVNAQRYSVAGLPCLYLGTSLYVCWLEMGKPDFDKLYISSFRPKNDGSKILNLASEFMILPTKEIDDPDKIFYVNREKASYLIFWPLIMACNYIRQNPESSFIQEYIIPNILMQWISRNTSSPIKGVAYFSTKMPNSRSSTKSINVVLPPQVTYEQTIKFKYCPNLANLFEFTSPISWQVLKTLEYPDPFSKKPEQARTKLHLDHAATTNRKIKKFDDDLVELYPLTDFYKLEASIRELFEHQTVTNHAIDGKK
ncbi:hypothetical protein F157LOC_01211 [Pectobacterium brasiliense]|uniref:hypothetical protein n=1 Tax=Pectobacterium brasiliense TaxID=180957 RepID=UPI000CE68B8E|nr:hypothetical protein [Pectobacterium brasiliense]PPE62365.1 hypothetical protein F157LOC_01211 [Pectobacterium brasiliense]